METKIKLKKNDVLKVEIEDENGNSTGNYLEFDLQDIDLPLRVQRLQEGHIKNLNYLKVGFSLVDKKKDKTGKKMLSSNEEEKLKIVKEFYNKEIELLDLVLGEGGAEKILNGRKPYYEMFNDIMEYLEPLAPVFEEQSKKMEQKLIEKYTKKSENTNVIEG